VRGITMKRPHEARRLTRHESNMRTRSTVGGESPHSPRATRARSRFSGKTYRVSEWRSEYAEINELVASDSRGFNRVRKTSSKNNRVSPGCENMEFLPTPRLDDETTARQRAGNIGSNESAGRRRHTAVAEGPEMRRPYDWERSPYWGNLSLSFLRCCRATSTHSFSVATEEAMPM
jgi:hypothetical protein